MSTIPPLNTNQPLVEENRTPTRTTTNFNEAIRKRLNNVAGLNSGTATLEQLIKALQDES